MDEIEDDQRRRLVAPAPADLRIRGRAQAALEELRRRGAVLAEHRDHAVEGDRLAGEPERDLPELYKQRPEVLPGGVEEGQVAGVAQRDRSPATPVDLEPPALGVARHATGRGEHRGDVVRQRLARLGRVHAMDHPVLAPRVEEGVATANPLALEAQHDLAALPLLGRVRAAVPDPHPPPAVLALGDVAGEVQVLERVVLGVDRESVAVRVTRDTARQRPGRQHPLVLEPQVPVQAGRVVLLDHVAARGRLVARCSLLVARLRGAVEVALRAVVGELVARFCHRCLCT